MLTQMQTKTKQHTRHTSRNPRVVFMAMLAAMLLPLASCINDNYDEEPAALSGKTVSMEMSIQTRSISDITSTSGATYVPGTEWENYINFAGGDYRIYFFTYNPTTETAGNGLNSILIAEFKPTEIYSTDLDTYTTYTMSGEVDEALVSSLENFKVVVLANWGTYPTVTASTTIDDLCNAQNALFNAFVSGGNAVMPSADHLIPFFGLCEYSGVTWTPDVQTKLSDPITMLRAVAKVEVVVESVENQDLSFDDVSIMNYNSQGYCAPTGVYLQSDYDHDGVWASDFVDGLHLVNDKNDSDTKTISFLRTQELETATDGSITQYETWTCYLTEYDNSGSDYSYIQVLWGGVPYNIYFANYDNGATTSTADYDIYRNYLYRFHVTYNGGLLRIRVEEWGDVFDNEETFGETDPQRVGYTFSVNGIGYKVLTSTVAEDGSPNPEVSLENLAVGTTGGTFETVVEIPDTIVYHGFRYTVTAIGEYTFDGQTGITSITLPETIESIGTYAFRYCTSLTSLTVLNYTPPGCGEELFYGVTTSNITLYVHDVVEQTYKENTTWGSFGFKAIVGI